MTATATESFGRVKSQVEKIVNDSPQSLHTMEPMDEWRQGDVRIVRLPDDFGEKFKSEIEQLGKVPSQVAPGDTVGSRHCLDSTKGITAFRMVNGNDLDSPVLKLTEPRSLLHPEHGDCVSLPVGWYAFPGQRVFAEEVRRTLD